MQALLLIPYLHCVLSEEPLLSIERVASHKRVVAFLMSFKDLSSVRVPRLLDIGKEASFGPAQTLQLLMRQPLVALLVAD